MDEQEGLNLVAQVFGSDKEITVTLPARELWLIVSALQLQITHPNLHAPLQTLCEGIGRKLGALIVEDLPQVGELLEMGWHREYDYIEQDDGEYEDVNEVFYEHFTYPEDIDDGDYDDADDPDADDRIPW